MQIISRNDLSDLFKSVSEIMTAHSEELCEMDAKMGDGDLGLTMKKGFSALPDILKDIPEENPGKALMKAGMKMTSVVPSTMGTLMSSGIMTGGKSISDKDSIDASTFVTYLFGFAEGLKKRGKCSPGDRTVLDAIQPAAESAKAMLDSNPNADLPEIVSAALDGAKKGLEATKGMTPKFGKAAVFADRAKGVIDQGAYAGMLMIQGYVDYIHSK